MRQGGMKPKSHSSGTYWIRANGSNKKTKHDPKKNEADYHFLDTNQDGEVDVWEISRFIFTWVGVVAVIGWLFWLEYS